MPQTHSASYKLAFQDIDFLLREDLRPVRFQLELMKPEVLLDEANIVSTFVFYGSARIPSREVAAAELETAKQGKGDLERAKMRLKMSRYYEDTRELARRLTLWSKSLEGTERRFVVCSGGGPSIMEAANRGAHDVGAQTIGLNIVLPHEQAPNAYVTPDLSFNFHYFAIRKMHFLMRAKAVCVFPGGFGTLDEMFESLTLIQTGRMKPIPFLLFGREWWETVINWTHLADAGVIAPEDLSLFAMVETAEEAVAVIDGWGAQ